jgi:DNA-binding transcriptional regulator GbsR (MarR family)
MTALASSWKRKRDDLKKRRDSLFEIYSRDPQNFHLAREIKDIDDDIAECTQHVEQERRAEQRAAAAADKVVTTPK